MKWLALCLLFVLTPGLADELGQDFKQWQSERDEEIAGPEGWMTLVGMHWLETGRYTLGSSIDNDIVLPGGLPRLGVLQVDGSEVHFQAHSEDDLPLIDGQPTFTSTLKVDIAGSAHSVISLGSLRLFVVQRGGLALRVRDLEAPARLNYSGTRRFEFDQTWRIEADFEPHPDGRTIEYLDAKGFTRTSANPGRVVFERNGKAYSLEVASEPGEKMFLIFADQTNGKQSYGAGRFLYAPWPSDGRTVLDFNRAHNPPCVFSEYANCPLPPRGNRLRLRVTAGEQVPTDKG
jgi:uncharacterized protein (DUF1684 family)